MKSFTKEIIITLILLILLFALINPLGTFMPTPTEMLILALLVVVFIIFGIFIWKEHALDEREQLHRMQADRIAFLVGASILLLGIIIQAFMHALNPWLPIALGAMIIAKVATRLYIEYRK